MILRLSFTGRRTLMKQGVMPEIVVSGIIFLITRGATFVAMESFGDSIGTLFIVILATRMLAPGGLETMYSNCCFPVMIVAQL